MTALRPGSREEPAFGSSSTSQQEHVAHPFANRYVPSCCFGFARWVEDSPLFELDVLNPNATNLTWPEAGVLDNHQNVIQWLLANGE